MESSGKGTSLWPEALNRDAIRVAEEIRALDSRAARRIASDALRELTGEKVQRRIGRKKH